MLDRLEINPVGNILSERSRFPVTIFRDEYNKLSLSEELTLKEAQDSVRHELGLPPRQRKALKGQLRKLISEASEEKIEEVLIQWGK